MTASDSQQCQINACKWLPAVAPQCLRVVTSSGSPTSAIACSEGRQRPSRSVTPSAELVVAPAGYSFTAATKPLASGREVGKGGRRIDAAHHVRGERH